MEDLKRMKECLISQVQSQMGNLAATDTKELGQAIDMIKDLAEATYYCAVVKAMEQSEKKERLNYIDYMPYEKSARYNPVMPQSNRMYYPGNTTNWDSAYPMTVRDSREGRSPMTRKNYIESKEMHQDKVVQMQQLEKYLKELSGDITELVSGATPEEKQILKQKITNLGNMIN